MNGRSLKVIAYGGGVQSSAMIVLAVQGRIPDVDAALFSNVGDDSEHPATLRYVREVMLPSLHYSMCMAVSASRAATKGCASYEQPLPGGPPVRPRRLPRPQVLVWYPTRPHGPDNPDKAGPCRCCTIGTMIPRGASHGGLWATCNKCGTSRYVEAT